MKQIFLTSVAMMAFAFTTAVLFSGGANAGQKAKVIPAVVATQQCHYPEDPGCPLSPQQAALLEGGHDLTPEQQKAVDQMDLSGLCLPSIGQCPKKTQ